MNSIEITGINLSLQINHLQIVSTLLSVFSSCKVCPSFHPYNITFGQILICSLILIPFTSAFLSFPLSIHATIILKCHPGLHNNLIKTKEKRLPSLKPLYSCSSVAPNTTHCILSRADICVGGLNCSLVKNCSPRISSSSLIGFKFRMDLKHRAPTINGRETLLFVMPIK